MRELGCICLEEEKTLQDTSIRWSSRNETPAAACHLPWHFCICVYLSISLVCMEIDSFYSGCPTRLSSSSLGPGAINQHVGGAQ